MEVRDFGRDKAFVSSFFIHIHRERNMHTHHFDLWWIAILQKIFKPPQMHNGEGGGFFTL